MENRSIGFIRTLKRAGVIHVLQLKDEEFHTQGIESSPRDHNANQDQKEPTLPFHLMKWSSFLFEITGHPGWKGIEDHPKYAPAAIANLTAL